MSLFITTSWTLTYFKRPTVAQCFQPAEKLYQQLNTTSSSNVMQVKGST